MNLAYIRVSTEEQNEDRQYKAMENLGIEKYFEEKISGKDTNRPKLQELLNFAREGDTIYVKDFSRLARSTKDLLDIVDSLAIGKVKLISLKENLDSSTATGKLMLTMIAAIYEFERANLLERQKEGIAVAKTKGIYKGRKPVNRPAEWDIVYNQYLTRKITGLEAMKELNLKRNTFYKFVNEAKGGAI